MAVRAELRKHGLADYFEVIVTSAECHIRKPNPLLFEIAATRLGVRPRVSGSWAIGRTPTLWEPTRPV
jgi:HAD superfamily hydrolase (TIGR01549 family)